MHQQYEHEFQFAVILPNGKTIYRLEEDEAYAVKEAVAEKRPIPPPKAQRLVPFGEGVEIVGERIVATYRGAHLGVFPTLKKALKAWDAEERTERFNLEKDVDHNSLDKRYYADLTYDDDGYKVFTPRPLVP